VPDVVISEAYGYIEGLISEILFERNRYKFDSRYDFILRHLLILIESYLVRDGGKIVGVVDGLTDLEKVSILSVGYRYYNDKDKESILDIIKGQMNSFSDIAKLVLIADYYQATGKVLFKEDVIRMLSNVDRDNIENKIIINYVVSILRGVVVDVDRYYSAIDSSLINPYGIKKDEGVLIPWLLIMHTLTYKNLNLDKSAEEVLSTMSQNINLLINMLQTRYTIGEKVEQQLPYSFVYGKMTDPIAISRMFEIFNLINTENMKQILKEQTAPSVSIDAIRNLLGAV